MTLGDSIGDLGPLPSVTARINELPDDDTVATTVVTFGEDLSG